MLHNLVRKYIQKTARKCRIGLFVAGATPIACKTHIEIYPASSRSLLAFALPFCFVAYG